MVQDPRSKVASYILRHPHAYRALFTHLLPAPLHGAGTPSASWRCLLRSMPSQGSHKDEELACIVVLPQVTAAVMMNRHVSEVIANESAKLRKRHGRDARVRNGGSGGLLSRSDTRRVRGCNMAFVGQGASSARRPRVVRLCFVWNLLDPVLAAVQPRVRSGLEVRST